jgi:hypothetical protein
VNIDEDMLKAFKIFSKMNIPLHEIFEVITLTPLRRSGKFAQILAFKSLPGHEKLSEKFKSFPEYE